MNFLTTKVDFQQKNMHKDYGCQPPHVSQGQVNNQQPHAAEVLTIEVAAKDTWFELWPLHVKHDNVKLSGTGWRME